MQEIIFFRFFFQDQESWVIVHHLQTQSGILDPDDKVNDVADDREQILASFEDTGPDPGVPQGGGDGASGSSVGTGSPDIFRVHFLAKTLAIDFIN